MICKCGSKDVDVDLGCCMDCVLVARQPYSDEINGLAAALASEKASHEETRAVLRREVDKQVERADRWVINEAQAREQVAALTARNTDLIRRLDERMEKLDNAVEALTMIEFLARGGDGDAVLDVARQFIAKLSSVADGKKP